MSGGEILRKLLEEKQSYHIQALNKQRAANDLNVASSREQSPLVKQKSLQNRKMIQTPPRRALSDESPVTECAPHGSAAFSKSNSSSADSSRISNCNFIESTFTSITPEDGIDAANAGHQATNLRAKERLNIDGMKTNELQNCYLWNVTPLNPSSSQIPSSKHPKSSSAGEDSYHSDRKSKFLDSKLGKRKGKYATSITRSRSLHSAENSRLRPLTKADAGKIALTNSKQDLHDRAANSMNGSSRKPESVSTRNDLFQTFPNEPKNLANLPRSEESCRSLNDSEYQTHDQQRLVRFQNNMLMIPSSMGGISQPSVPQNNSHGPYYAIVPQNSITHHHHIPQMHPGTPSKKTSPISQQSSSVPRGPPPPYPQTSGCNDNSHPQRPKSLSLSGQVSRKKLEYGGAQGNVGGLTSPALPTTTHFIAFNNFPLSAGTPPQDMKLRSFPEQGKTTDTNQDLHKTFGVVSPIPETQFVRNAMGQGFQVSISSSQPQNPTDHSTKNASNTTAVSVKPHLRQDQPRSYNNNPNSNSQKQISAPLPSYPLQSYGEFQNTQPTNAVNATNSFSLGKSDSNASSTCSGGSRIARRTKRNSRNFSNVSGSSSSTGNSRPNSSADYLERILNENEALKNQLVAAEMKLKKYQHVEKELAQVTQDYQNFRLSVTKSETMHSTLIVQLESATKRTQDENELLRQRVTTLTEMVETLQSSDKTETTPTTNVSEYKTQVQELQDRERQLSEQYDEAVEKISEQSEDISLLNTSLERLQTNVASLKAELLEKQKMDRCAENLSPFLEALTMTIQSREQAERELNEITVAEQRQSISCNDEGISEMDSTDYPSPSSSTSTRKQLVCAHAQMLKWQHAYLQTAILKELSTSSPATTSNPLYAVLRKHRHAISEPSFCGNLGFDRPTNSTAGQLMADVGIKNISHNEESISPGQSEKSDKTNNRNRSFRQGNRAVNASESNRTASDVENELLNYSNMHSNSTAGKSRLNNSGVTASNEADSPSEGYHSQQSSGSPTPSSERSSVHFSEESQLSNSTPSSCGGCASICSVGSCKTVLSKGVDV